LCCKAQKMEVIGHQDIGVDGAIMRRRRFGEPGLQPAVVVLAKEDRLTVVASLDHVRRPMG
jgi:hypothetical protein